MLNKLIKFVFKIITKVFSMIFQPLFSAINALFPALGTYFGYITNFLNIALTYFTSACRLALIPQAVLIALFDYLLIKFAIFVAIQGFKFTLFVFEKLKP